MNIKNQKGALHSLFNDCVPEEDLGVSEQYIEHPVADLHGRTQYNRHILKTHLVLLFLHVTETVTLHSS